MRRASSSGLARRALPVAISALWLCSIFCAQAQLAVPEGADLFGDELVRKLSDGASKSAVSKQVTSSPEGYSHTLVFQDGRQLRGELVSLGKEAIVWRRPDASEPLQFVRSLIRRIVLSEPSIVPKPVPEVGKVGSAVQTPSSGRGASEIRATVKLGGVDWLYGKLSGPDGDDYSLEISPALSFRIPRAQMRWIYYDSHPAPSFGFFGHALDLDDWFDDQGRFRPSVENGILIQHRLGWFGHTTDPLNRFAVFLEVLEKNEGHLDLYLRHAGVGVFLTSDTIQLGFPYSPRPSPTLQFSKDGSVIIPNPPPPPRLRGPEGGTVKYRFFYDGSEGKLRAFCNGLRLPDRECKLSSPQHRIKTDYDERIRSIIVSAHGAS
ncbi:MAG TPA: hypothetical protein VGH90_01770, partial [Chthoniobacteraceae bacterium]